MKAIYEPRGAAAEYLFVGGPEDGKMKAMAFNDRPWHIPCPYNSAEARAEGIVIVRLTYGVYEPRQWECQCGRRTIVFVWKGWAGPGRQ
jgi:hypothetical protein